MHIYILEQYPNLLPKISLTSDEIKAMVSTYKLTFLVERNYEVEWGKGLPMFVPAFYNFILNTNKIPNQEEFYNYYRKCNISYYKKLNRPDLDSGIKARAYRTYPSLVRDIYFNKYIEEKIGTKCQIIYNTELDIEEGIDLMIITSKNKYGICFFTKNRRAFIRRKAKEKDIYLSKT